MLDLHNHMRGIPAQNHEGLLNYLLHHTPTGLFLEAVLSNDLREACLLADEDNQWALYNLIRFLHEYADKDAWGSVDKYRAWVGR